MCSNVDSTFMMCVCANVLTCVRMCVKVWVQCILAPGDTNEKPIETNRQSGFGRHGE